MFALNRNVTVVQVHRRFRDFYALHEQVGNTIKARVAQWMQSHTLVLHGFAEWCRRKHSVFRSTLPVLSRNRVSAKPPLCLFWGLDLRKVSSKHPTTCSCCARSRFNFVIYFVATTALFEPWTFRHPFLVVSERLSAGRCTCLYRCNFSPLAFEPPPSFAQRSNPCCSIFNVLLSLDRCRSCLACAGRVPHEGAPLEVLLAAIPWQEVKAVDEPRRCWLRRGPQKRP